MIERGDVFWVDLEEPEEVDHRPKRRRPVVVVQADSYNRSRLATIVVAVVTSNVAAARHPGNVLLTAQDTGLPRDSVVNVTQLLTLNRFQLLGARTGNLGAAMMQVDRGLARVLGLGSPRAR